MVMNPLISLLAALVPMFLGFIWYHPKVFGNAWMKSLGVSEEKLKEGFNMPLVFGLSYVCSFFIAFSLHFIVIHQNGLFALLQDEMNHPIAGSADEITRILGIYGGSFRTFHHGVLHGAITGIFLILPIITTCSLFERKGWKYILVNAGYWTVCLALMGGIICKWS